MSDNTNLMRELYILEDENNPYGSRSKGIWPPTILDQVYDNLSPTNKTLRTILEELRHDILTGGIGNITFPVTTVNGMNGDVIINAKHLGLENVDNTSDNEKPLSKPQRLAVMELLKGFEYEVDLSDLYDHIRDSNNPHGITFEHINRNNEIGNYISQHILKHENDQTSHQDIRNLIKDIDYSVKNIHNDVEERISIALRILDQHYADEGAHSPLFDKKEDVLNKVFDFENVDHKRYPSVRAVVDYVTSVANTLRSEITTIENWIDDIIVIRSRDDLPSASIKTYRKAYFIRRGLNNNDEIAICRMNPDNTTYSWDISTFDTYAKFDESYFINTDDGLSLNTTNIAETLINEGNMNKGISEIVNSVLFESTAIINFNINELGELTVEYDERYPDPILYIDENGELILEADDGTLSEFLVENCNFEIVNGRLILTTEDIDIVNIGHGKIANYYTKDEIDEFSFINSIQILSGTENGTIRYYINNDISTMSPDIKVTGINKLAFLEKVTENEIEDNSVHSQHILNRAIQYRHMGEKAVSAENMRGSYNTIFGNVEDSQGNTVREIPLTYLVEVFQPYIKDFIAQYLTSSPEMKSILKDIYEEIIAEEIMSEAPITLTIQDGSLIATYDETQYSEPDIEIDKDGYLILNSSDTVIDQYLESIFFNIVDSTLVMTVNE